MLNELHVVRSLCILYLPPSSLGRYTKDEANMNEERKTADQLAEAYIKLRDERALLKKQYENEDDKLSMQMDDISRTLLELCTEQNASSITTAHGTVIRSVTTRYWTNDWGSLYEVINKYKAPYLLHKSITNSAMRDFLEEHPEAHPPGLNVDSKYTISVRRPSNKI